jgi:hypothetical protein
VGNTAVIQVLGAVPYGELEHKLAKADAAAAPDEVLGADLGRAPALIGALAAGHVRPMQAIGLGPAGLPGALRLPGLPGALSLPGLPGSAGPGPV